MKWCTGYHFEYHPIKGCPILRRLRGIQVYILFCSVDLKTNLTKLKLIMSNIETAHLISRYMNQKVQQLKNNNNSISESSILVSSPPYTAPSVSISISASDAKAVILTDSTGASGQSALGETAQTSPRNSMSPSSASRETMSPPAEQPTNANNGYHYTGSYHSNFVNSLNAHTTNLQPKKSFCIEALLSKSKANGNYSPPPNKLAADDDGAQSYAMDDRREYMSSPEDGMSR